MQMKKIFFLALLVPLTVIAQTIEAVENQKTQITPLANLFGGIQKLITTKAQEIENLIELNDFNNAIEKYLSYYFDLSEEKKSELRSKLRPFVEAEVAEWNVNLEKLDVAEKNFNATVDKFKALEQFNDTSARKFNLLDIRKVPLDKALYEKKKKIYEEIVNSFLSSPSLEIQKQTIDFLQSDAYLLASKCRSLISSDAIKASQVATKCKALLPAAHAGELDSALMNGQLSQISSSYSAHQKIIELDKIIRLNGITGSNYQRLFTQNGPKLLSLDDSNVKQWLSEKRNDQIGIYIQVTEPTQNVSKRSRSSSIVAGYETVTNPQYLIAQRNYQAVVIDYQNCQANYRTQALTNPYAVNFCGFVAATANNAKSVLDSTSPTLRNEVLKNYNFEVNSVEVTKNGVAYMFAYSTEKKKFLYEKTTVSKTKKFDIALGLNPQDKYLSTSNFQTENDIRTFLEEKLDRPVDFEIYSALLKASQQVDNPEKIFQQAKSSNVQISSSEPRAISAKNSIDLNDLLNNSIVVIKTRTGIGTGFYVRSKYLLTNRHVVEDQAMVEVEYKDGRKANGVVIQTDPTLDLALIVVPAEGRAMQFLTKEASIGAEAIALGHPKGLTFSVTKGIVSAVRDMPSSIGIPMQLRYVQTDVPINSGNSGGPLLVGDKVVGINTFKRVDSGSEGLGFALSSVKVLEWLNRSIPK
jgi:S1-C subfamily serine protease